MSVYYTIDTDIPTEIDVHQELDNILKSMQTVLKLDCTADEVSKINILTLFTFIILLMNSKKNVNLPILVIVGIKLYSKYVYVLLRCVTEF